MPELARSIGTLPWIEDGIGAGAEFNAARGVVLLAEAEYLASLLEEPWVAEGKNYAALESLWKLQINRPEKLARILSHPTISDGINDQEAKVIAVISPGSATDLPERLLDPARGTLEERTITLPLAGETDISIIRSGPGTDHAMDSLEHAVRSIEEFMGLPFPRRQVIYLIDLLDVIPSRPGNHLGTHVVLWIDEQVLPKESMADLVAHETSHYYWGYGGGTDWANEGAATFLESIVKNVPHGPLDHPPCPLARSITELEALQRELSNPWEARYCHYRLGERLFRDLYRNMDDTTFRLAFRRLFLHTVFSVRDDCSDDWLTDCHVKEAFTAYVPEEEGASINNVVDRWYDGTEPYDLSYIEDIPVNPEIAAISGRIDRAYLSLSRSGSPVSAVTLEPNRNPVLYLNLDYSYRNSSGLESLPLEIVHYFEDGFDFQRIRVELPVPANNTQRIQDIWIHQENTLGRYWVNVYLAEQKIAETTYEILPAPDLYSIRGVVTGPDGQPATREIALWVKRGEERFWVKTGPDGTFDVEVSSGTFTLEVNVLFGTHWNSVGWYDGSGGITTDRSQAYEVVIDDTGVEGIDIKLPVQP